MPASSKPWPFRIEYPPELPISARVDEIVTAIQRHPVVVLAGETGSGKTTQIPKMCLAAGCGDRGRIACTQPRRVAATSVSRRVAQELGVEWGREVGCKIRFGDRTTAETVVKFMTDGMLLAEMQADPELREYDTVIVDEAHERSLNIDFILGHLRRLRHTRPDLKIVVTSATIDTEAFSKAFDGAPVIEVSGRVYPVEVIYSPMEEMRDDAAGVAGVETPGRRGSRKSDDYTYLDAAVEAVERILRESAQGDVLVFMPTERDIRETCEMLEGRGAKGSGGDGRPGAIEVVPLFGRLTNAEQERVFAPAGGRKIVVATNIAETSLTIPGIRFVVDTGLARVSHYSPQNRTRRLPVEPIARSSADQRKGRCGRVSDGVCIRLYSEQDYEQRPRFAQPEIQRSNLADVILRMKAFGLGDIEVFPFLNAPPAKGIRAAYALLHELGALAGGGASEGRASHGEGQTGARSADNGPASPAGGQGHLAPRASIPSSNLTDLGRELARIPVDPTIGRMILQAREEKALDEILVIAAGLSIQDPRERPLDQQAKADAAHRRFTHPDSDFLTLLAIWEAYHDEFERMTLGKLRRFCATHFLSFPRMREWRDVHAQLADLFRDRGGFTHSSVYDGPANPGGGGRPARSAGELRIGTPGYRSIHRAILSGLLGNIAVRDEDGMYRATHDRKVGIFPGSTLAERRDPRVGPSERSGGRKDERPRAKGARWIVAAETVETGRTYARTCARIDPQWALDLGSHLLRVSHAEPFWNAEAGRVLVKERRRLYNLELETRSVGYSRIDPAHATEILIREGLVGDTITWPFDFLAHNRKLRERVEAVLTRTRSAGYMNVDEAIYRYYAAQLLPDTGAGSKQAVGSVAELVDLVRHRQMQDPRFLLMRDDDLRPETAADEASYPEALPLDNRVLPLAYAYKPGEENDGVTLRVPLSDVAGLTPAALDWAVPGHLREKIEILLKALPKEQRRTLIPLGDSAARIEREIGLIAGRSPQPTLQEALGELLTGRFGVRVDPRWWVGKSLPDHLRVRVEVVDPAGRAVASGRDLAEVQAAVAGRVREVSLDAARGETEAWRAARRRVETDAAEDWRFGDVPATVTVEDRGGIPLLGFPGIQVMAGGVAVRLFASAEEARQVSRAGIRRLLELRLRHDIGWLEKDLRSLRNLGPLAATLAPVADIQKQALESIVRWVTDPDRLPKAQRETAHGSAVSAAGSLASADDFSSAVERAKRDLRGLVPRLEEWLREILSLRLDLQTGKQPYPGLEDDIESLLPSDFLRRTPFERLKDLARYLKAMQARSERWKRDPAKDAQRAAELKPFAEAARRIAAADEAGAAEVTFRWLVEEFRVSLFAQELGTSGPVSAVRLERALKDLPGPAQGKTDADARQKPQPEPRSKPAPLPVKGKTVLKSFDALSRFG